MKGWKTYVGAAIMAATAVLGYLGYGQYNEALFAIGAALGIYGLRHKMERGSPGK